MTLDDLSQDALDSLSEGEQRDLLNRFGFHPASETGRGEQHDSVRATCLGAAAQLSALLPPCREKALALTNLEQAMFWANAAVARQG